MMQAITTHSLIRHILYSISETVEPKKAIEISRNGGLIAGEDHAYQFLDLQDPLPVFLEKMIHLNNSLFYTSWNLQNPTTISSILCVDFDIIKGCKGHFSKQPPLQCEWMGGYLTGLMRPYLGCQLEFHMSCSKSLCHKNPDAKNQQQCRCELYRESTHPPVASDGKLVHNSPKAFSKNKASAD